MSSTFSPAAKSSLTYDTTAPGQASSNLPPRPQHFITRGDGSITPLIAVDELPESIRIIGVPAIISQAATLNMMNLGVQTRSQTKYIVEMPEDSGSGNTCNLSQRSITTGGNFQSLDKRFGLLKTIKREEDEEEEENTAAGVNEVEEWRLGVNSVDETQVRIAIPPPQSPSLLRVKKFGDLTSTRFAHALKAAIDAVVAANAKSGAIQTLRAPKALTPGVFGEKKYCTHWIRWGECDYMQQGCKYKHEMPDEETLVAIGIRSIPKWYKEANTPKNGWVERPSASERVWRESSARAIQQQMAPYRLPYLSGVELFRPPYGSSSDEPFRSPFQSSAERFHHSRQPLGPMPGTRPTFPNGFAPLPGPFPPSSNVQMRTVHHHQYLPPPAKLLGSKIKIGVPSSSRFPVTSSSIPRQKSTSTKRLVPTPITTPVSSAAATAAAAAAAAAAPPPSVSTRSGAPPSPFSPPLTTQQPLSPAGVLPTSLAPTHRSLLPFIPPPEPFILPPTPVPEIKTPAPRHRRLFVAAGESTYVENGKSENKDTGEMGDGGKWEELGKGIEELLVDFEE